MLIDTSALVSIYNKEGDWEDLARILASAKRWWLSVASYLEFVMVVRNSAWIDRLMEQAEIELVAVSVDDIKKAVEGFYKHGKGMGRAGLNFGDLIVYGTAKAAQVAVLFKGDDFSKTEVLNARSAEEG